METETFSVDWGWQDPTKKDAVWYYGMLNAVGEATLTTAEGKTFSLYIYCDGETKFRLPNKNEDGTLDFDNTDYVRYADDWEAHGINTDEQMNAYLSKLETEHDWEAHIFNSWFDLYAEIDGVVEHLDAVTHETDDAEAQAEAILREVAKCGSWEAYAESLGW